MFCFVLFCFVRFHFMKSKMAPKMETKVRQITEIAQKCSEMVLEQSVSSVTNNYTWRFHNFRKHFSWFIQLPVLRHQVPTRNLCNSKNTATMDMLGGFVKHFWYIASTSAWNSNYKYVVTIKKILLKRTFYIATVHRLSIYIPGGLMIS